MPVRPVKGELLSESRFHFADGSDGGDSPRVPIVIRSSLSIPALLFSALLLQSCQTVNFYGQAIGGQMEIFRKSQPIPPIITNPATDAKLRRQLIAVEGIREFATDHLTLPGDESYGTYADLGREYVAWVIYAAPEFSLKPKTWWYPTLGNLDYRGCFRKTDADKIAAGLRGDGYDVTVAGVDAYSTLGWFHDPVLNCFVNNSDINLAELIFHELTHRRLFRNGDTAFNEALATAYSEECVKRWLIYQKRDADLRRYQQLLVRRNQFYNEIDLTRIRLETLYASGKPPILMRYEKSAVLGELRQHFRELRKRWGGHGLESWLTEDLNNAHLVSIITYQKNVPIFHQLLKDCHGDSDLFFKRAKALPKLSP